MAGYFCDSSAVVKRYISEIGTGWIIGLMRAAAKNEFAVAQLTGVEVVSAITPSKDWRLIIRTIIKNL